MQSDIVFGYWKIRGLGFHVITLLEYLGVEYKFKSYEQGDAPEYSRKVWLDEKHNLGLPFPNLPYLIDGDVKLTETLAIINYLAKKYDEKLLGQTPADYANVQMLLLLFHEFKGYITMPCYRGPDASAAVQIINERLPQLLAYLGNKNYFVGDQLTLADLYFLEVIEYMMFVTKGEVLTKYPKVNEVRDRLLLEQNLKKWRQSDRYFDGPFNNKIAAVNN